MNKLLSVVLLSSALSAVAHGQQGSVEFRQSDAFKGPVRTARIEHATYSRVDGALVEGPRQLSSFATYAPDGKQKVTQGYAPDGTPKGKYVSTYDDDGNEVEVLMFDARGNLWGKKVHRPAAGETLMYNGDESLRERRVIVRRPDGTLSEVLVYDGSGALRERSVNERDAKTSVWSTYGADGKLRKRDEHALNYGGPHHSNSKTYAPDGKVVGRTVSDVDAGASDLRATVVKGDGGPPRKMRETREYDARRNLKKITNFSWNAETQEYEPVAVSYYTIEYYR